MKTLLISTFVLVFFILGFNISNPEGIFHLPTSGHTELSSTESQFRDVTSGSGIPTSQNTTTLVFGDYDNDGWVDLISSGRLYRNVSSYSEIRFSDQTELSGLGNLQGAPLFTDIDNDGRLDILTTRGQLFLQLAPGRFTESSQDLGFSLPEHIHHLSVVDLNGDGFIDILAGFAEPKFGAPLIPPRMFMNLQGKRIINFISPTLQLLPNYTRSIAVADYNNNGRIGAYFSNYRLRPNNLFVLGSSTLTDYAPSLNIQGIFAPNKFYNELRKSSYGTRYGHSISSIWADLDNDGNLDLWVSNLVHKYVGIDRKGQFDPRGYLCDDSKIYRNSGYPSYKFIDMRPTSGIPYRAIGDFSKFTGDELWAQTTAADYDNDGLMDVYVSQVYDLPYSHSLLFKNLGNFKFKDVGITQGTRVYDSYAAAWADINNDGKMDLVQSGRLKNKEAPVFRILQNINNDKNNYLKINLTGSHSGTHAVTAQVRVFHSKGVFMRQVDGVTGTMNQQNDPTLHFGLGQVQHITKVEVRWPSGKNQTFTNVSVNRTIKIEEPQ